MHPLDMGTCGAAPILHFQLFLLSCCFSRVPAGVAQDVIKDEWFCRGRKRGSQDILLRQMAIAQTHCSHASSSTATKNSNTFIRSMCNKVSVHAEVRRRTTLHTAKQKVQ
eukprot:5127640-Amphidinium_carterae.4